MTPDPDRPRVRALALGAVVLVVTAAGAVARDAGSSVLALVALGLGAAAAWRWRQAGRTGVSTSLAVAAVLVGLLLVERVTGDVDVVLAVTGTLALVAGAVLRERRLAVSGLLTFGVLLGRPPDAGASFSHCLVATDVAVPVPHLDGPLLLALGATVLGTASRWFGWGDRLDRTSVARGVEMTGAIGLAALLLAKAMELPGHRLLCGTGDPLDEGWVVLGVAFGVVAGLYGLAARDLVWEGVGLASITLHGVVATALTGAPWWAAGCGVLLAGALATAEYLRVPWPDQPGYEVARPRLADLRLRARRRQDHDREEGAVR